MVNYPARGTPDWDDDLQQYIDGHHRNVQNSAVASAAQAETARLATVAVKAQTEAVRAQTETARAQAIAAKIAAEAAETRIEGLVIDDLGTTDSQSAALIKAQGSLTEQALTATFAPTSVLKPVSGPPVGFRAFKKLPMPTIRRTPGGFKALLNVTALRPPAGVTYYVAPNGTANADGLTAATPTTVQVAATKTDVGTIIYADGEYFRELHSINAANVTRSINHIAAPGARPRGFSPNTTALVWTVEAGHIYKVARSSIHTVIDVVNEYAPGVPRKYVRRATLAEVVGPGEWFTDAVTTYVWALGNANLSQTTARQQIRLITATGVPGVARNGLTQYVEGLEVWGSLGAGDAGSLLIAQNTNVRFALADGFASYNGAKGTIGINVEVTDCAADGFNYHDVPQAKTEAIEINCRAYRNGIQVFEVPGTNNASTAHESCTVIRVNGDYDQAAGPVVCDVNNSQSWNLGCRSGGHAVTVSSAQRQSWRVSGPSLTEGDGPATMWLDECTSESADYGLGATNGSIMRVHAHGAGNPLGAVFPASVPIETYTR